MQRLCAPDRMLWFIEHDNEGQLEAVKKRYGLKSVVVCNLRQLLGWSKVGTPKGGRHDRDKRKEVANFQIVFAAEKLASTETVQWLQHVTGGEVVPLSSDQICECGRHPPAMLPADALDAHVDPSPSTLSAT